MLTRCTNDSHEVPIMLPWGSDWEEGLVGELPWSDDTLPLIYESVHTIGCYRECFSMSRHIVHGHNATMCMAISQIGIDSASPRSDCTACEFCTPKSNYTISQCHQPVLYNTSYMVKYHTNKVALTTNLFVLVTGHWWKHWRHDGPNNVPCISITR